MVKKGEREKKNLRQKKKGKQFIYVYVEEKKLLDMKSNRRR